MCYNKKIILLKNYAEKEAGRLQSLPKYLAQSRKYSKIEQGFKNVIPNFACFLTATAIV